MALILIVDDDQLVIEVARAALEARGHVIGELPDGSRVKEVVEHERPDLVILDCAMPGVRGIDALRQVRTSPLGYGTPVVMLTARRSSGDEYIAIRAGADDYLRKPFEPDQLVACVEALLDSCKARAAAARAVN